MSDATNLVSLIKHHDMEAIKEIIGSNDCPIVYINSYIIPFVVTIGDLEIFKLFYEDERFSFAGLSDQAICFAAEYGHIEIFNLLYALKEVDPSAKSNTPFIKACQKGHLSIVKTLAEDRRVNIYEKGQLAFKMAIARGHTEIVEYLLNFPDFNVNYESHKGLKSSLRNNHYDIFKLLYQDARFDYELDLMEVYSIVSSKQLNSNEEILNIFHLLVQDDRFNFDQHDNEIILRSIRYSQDKITSILFRNKKVNKLLSETNSDLFAELEINNLKEIAEVF